MEAHDVKPGEICRDAGMRVVAITAHGSTPTAIAWKRPASGDTTTFSPGLIAAAKGCDILAHEVYSEKGLANRTADWQRYHSAYRTSAHDVGRVAAAVQPKKLMDRLRKHLDVIR